MKRTELTSYLLVRKLARRGSAEGYRTNRSRIYWYNSSDYSLWLLLRVDASKIKARHACPRWPSFCWVCLFYPHPFPSIPLSFPSLFLLCSLPSLILPRYFFWSPQPGSGVVRALFCGYPLFVPNLFALSSSVFFSLFCLSECVLCL